MEITDAMVERAIEVLSDEMTLPYMARISDFTDEQVKAGELRRADAEADAQNRSLVRRAVEAAVSGVTVWIVSGWDRDGYAVYGVYVSKEAGEAASSTIDEPTVCEPFVVGAPPVAPT